MNSAREFTDVEIVAGAYEKWGAACLARLTGDWALSIWNPRERSLILAKDFVGTRHLYYVMEKDRVTWSTMLDPLVLFAERTFAICEEYIADWFAILFPAVHLTPYVGIHSVPPSSSVFLRPGKHRVGEYWNFDPGNRVRYRTDAGYEEHFRFVFGRAVQRTLRSDYPILAELSGGVDSSSIVCMADSVIARGVAEVPRLDTVSWYDTSDPNWGERPYVSKVEEKRGRAGCHIDFGVRKRRVGVGSREEIVRRNSLLCEFSNDRLVATPVFNRRLSEAFKEYEAYIASQGYRVTLSGIGGEEATGGGVPTPRPELQNLLAGAHFFALAHTLNAWAAKMKRSRLLLLWEAVREFFFCSPLAATQNIQSIPWPVRGFDQRNRAALHGYPSRVKLFGPLPAFQNHINELNHVRRFLAYRELAPECLREVRFPYLDRDLLEFVYAVPEEQLVRVGQRRSLMKRALVGIVPHELLNRRKKAPTPRESNNDNWAAWPSLDEIGHHIVSSSLGITDPNRLLRVLQKAHRNEEVPFESLMRTVKLESWLRHLMIQGVLTGSMTTTSSKNAVPCIS